MIHNGVDTATIDRLAAGRVDAPLNGVIAFSTAPETFACPSTPVSGKGGANQFKDYGEHQKTIVLRSMKWLDGELSDGRAFLAGATYSMADIVLLCGIDFCSFIGLDVPSEFGHLRDWHTRVSARPSAGA